MQPAGTKPDDADPSPPKRRNRRQYPEKGLVSALQATADKMAVVTSRAMADDELGDETMESIEALVAQMNAEMDRLRQTHRQPPEPPSTVRKRKRVL